jgi:PAP2 superfamily
MKKTNDAGWNKADIALCGYPYFSFYNSNGSWLIVCIILSIISISVSGCGTLSNGRGWGQDAIYPVDLSKIPNAAYHAFFDVQALVPAAGALIFTIDHYDRKVSNWAFEHRPIYGSDNTGNNINDILSRTLKVEALATALVTPSGKEPMDWTWAKAKGLLVEWSSVEATAQATAALKRVAKRTRPDGSDNKSFPSYDSSQAFSYATLSNRNLNSIHMPSALRIPLQVTNIAMASGIAWQRVEGKKHFPSDVLAGAAIGHFLTTFINDAFLALPDDSRFGFVILPMKGGIMTQVGFAF